VIAELWNQLIKRRVSIDIAIVKKADPHR